jgi:hypothetical protein
MKSYGMSLCALACFTTLALPCAAQDNSQTNSQSNPWNGSWKMDRSSLKYDGPTYSFATDSAGYTMTRGDKPGPKVVCDGKPNPPDNGTTTTCTKTATGYALENTRGDKTTSKVKVEISPDGKTMTRTADITPPDGSPFTMTFVSTKVGGSGNTAQWKETSFNESQDTGVLSVQVNGDSIDFKESDNDKPVTCKLDGTPANLGGTRTMSCKLDDPKTLKVTYSNDGKVDRENTFALSADGNTVTETDITTAPSSKMTVTFHKS